MEVLILAIILSGLVCPMIGPNMDTMELEPVYSLCNIPCCNQKVVHHLKFLAARIAYNSNSTATFQLSLLVSGDVNPNPGPDNVNQNTADVKLCQHKIVYNREQLLSFNSTTTTCSLPKTILNLIDTIGIQPRPPRRSHRGKRGRRRNRPIRATTSEAANTLDQPTNSSQSHKSACSNFALWNARSIRSKTVMISDLIITNRIDILAITETWLDGDHRDNHAIADLTSTLPDYQLHHVPRQNRTGGGILVFLRKNFNEGYDSHLTDYYGTHQYSPRPSGMTLADNYADDPNNPVVVNNQRYHYHRILDAINTGTFTTKTGQEPVNIVSLGAAVEASISSPNMDLYGSVHNYGHDLTSVITDPDGRYEQAYGVMGDTGTAIRDPIFFRWHKFIDGIFVSHKVTLNPYTNDELRFDDISVDNMSIEAPGNILTTRMEKQKVDISKDMFLQQVDPDKPHTPVYVEVNQVNHKDFSYKFTVTNNTGGNVQAAFRIFMAPKIDQHGKPILLTDQRRLFIEMDKFVEDLTPGKNNIGRSSTLSSVIKPPGKSHDDILALLKKSEAGPDEKSTGDCKCRDQRYCTCGWPLHMLVPRGTPAGMRFDLFVMLTNWEHVDTDDLDQGTSYCGVKDEEYPDKRAMGFPFDRQFDSKEYPPQKAYIDSLVDDFPNMLTIPITIKFHQEAPNA